MTTSASYRIDKLVMAMPMGTEFTIRQIIEALGIASPSTPSSNAIAKLLRAHPHAERMEPDTRRGPSVWRRI